MKSKSNVKSVEAKIAHLLPKLKKLGVKKKPLIALLASDPYSPDKWRSEFDIRLHQLKANRSMLTSLLQRTARELERIVLPLPIEMRAQLIPIINADLLVALLKILATEITKPKHIESKNPSVLSDLLDALPSKRRGRSSVTSARDHRIWKVCSLIKNATGRPFYPLIAEIVNAVYGYELYDHEIKKIISRHPNKYTYWPKPLPRKRKGKISEHRPNKIKFPKKMILYSPPVKLGKSKNIKHHP